MTRELAETTDSFRNMDLSRLNLSGINFSRRINPISEWDQIAIEETQRCLGRNPYDYDPPRNDLQMPGRDFHGATLNGTNLDGANLANCNLTCLTAKGASFRGANLQGATLANSLLDECDFTDADLSGVTFT